MPSARLEPAGTMNILMSVMMAARLSQRRW
jgi:hypothetical protein